MLTNLKLIFVHGVNDQTTNYSHELYQKILKICRERLAKSGQDPTMIDNIVQHEILWANLTTDLTNRYQQLASAPKQQQFSTFFISLCPLVLLALLMKMSFFRERIALWLRQKLIEGIDPLAIQIMHYIKDKGDKKNGDMNILNDFDMNIKRIFSQSNDDVGYDALSGEGKNVIIIAHSLGSVIAFDYVMGFRKEYALDKGVRVKSFITMGSPLPVFTSAMGHPDSDLKFPSNLKRWVNIINPLDGIARPIQAFFRNMPIKEEQVSTFGYDPISAHTGYWKDEKTAEIIAKEVLAALKQ